MVAITLRHRDAAEAIDLSAEDLFEVCMRNGYLREPVIVELAIWLFVTLKGQCAVCIRSNVQKAFGRRAFGQPSFC